MVLSRSRVANGPTDECQAVILSEDVIASTDKIKEDKEENSRSRYSTQPDR